MSKLGDTIRIYGTLLVNDTPTEPNTLRLDIIDPTGTTTSYTWGTDGEVVREDTGQFYFDLMLTQRGEWSYEWYSNSTLTAFETGTIEVADEVVITSVNDQVVPAVEVPFVQFRLHDDSGTEVDVGLDPQRTGAAGTVSLQLEDGTYRLSPFKLGWIFDVTVFDVAGDGPHAVEVPGRTLASRWLQWEDLEAVVDVATIDRLFHDDNSGFRNMKLIETVIQGAEALAESKLLRSWSREQIYEMAGLDTALRHQAAWLALEMATERKQEFVSSDGKGRYWAQYERSIAYFDALSKSKDHSRGEVVAKSANTGGQRRPTLRVNQDPFLFAPGRNGRGPGGF